MEVDNMNRKTIEYESGLYRFMNSKDLYDKFLKDFLFDKTFSQVKKAFEEKNLDELKNTVHTLKGISGNLSMSALYNACSEAMTYMRSKNELISNELYAKISLAYDEVIIELEKLFDGGK